MKPIFFLPLTLCVACNAVITEPPLPERVDQPPGQSLPLPPPAIIATRPTNGSALMMTTDDSKLLVLNRRTGSGGQANAVKLEKYSVDLPNNTLSLEGAAEVPGARQVVIAPDNDTAYVAGAWKVWKYTGIKSNGLVQSTSADTGGEPRGIALSPNGRWLFVANWSDGTVTEFDTKDMSVYRTIDLNGVLVSAGWLGSVQPRLGLAHPFAIAVTNNGDDSVADETVYVTEFFSQQKNANVPEDDSMFDVGRIGVVYQFNLGTGVVGPPIPIAPIIDTGFADSNGGVTGCFANQLNAATINSGRLYVTGICSSPRGPVGPVLDPNTGALANPANFKTQIHGAIWTIELASGAVAPEKTVLLTRAFQDLYDQAGLPDDGANRRIPLIPNDITFVPGRTVSYVTAYGSDAVFRVEYGAEGTLTRVGATTASFIDLIPPGQPAGRMPYGMTIAHDGTKTLVVNEYTRNISFVVFATQNVVNAVNLTDATPIGVEADINNGHRFFVTGLGRWSFKGQAWNSCETCHPDGRTDNVTWFFARGPRQTISLDATYGASGTRRLLNWTAINDELHDFELNTRGNSGGVGAIVHANSMPISPADRIHFDGSMPIPAGTLQTNAPQSGLNGSTVSMMPGGATSPSSVLEDWNKIDAYVKVIAPPYGARGLNASDVEAGRRLFIDNNCAGCHGGEDWTISRVFYTPSETTSNPQTGSLRNNTYNVPPAFPARLNPPSSGGSRTAPLRFVNADPVVVAANDQINCVLRAVGTYPAMLDARQSGVAATGVRVREVRANMAAAAQGATGFNPPSLVGMVTGAPYFHAGNARTLEEALDSAVFAEHAQALSANYPGAGDRATLLRQLATFLVSVDQTTAPIALPELGYALDLCPTAR